MPDDHTKTNALARHGLLHPHPERVCDPLFDDDSFFDRLDLLQVKYEMLRHVRVDGQSVRHAARNAGLSRPTFYSARAAFEQRGLHGLIPEKKGPKRAHKLSDDVLDLVEELLCADPGLDFVALAGVLDRRLQLTVHPQSIQRALARRQKKKGGP